MDGKEYSKNGLAGIRSAIHRHLTSAPYHCKFNIMRDVEFKSANNVLIGTVKKMKREGKDITHSFVPISSDDLKKLVQSGILSVNDPIKLQDLVWFSIQFYLCRRGCEGVKDLRKESFRFHTDASGKPFVTLAYNEASKNHPGGFKNTNDPKRRMYATGGPLCPVMALKKYLGKLHPDSEVLYQRPAESYADEGPWYLPLALGMRKLQNMMSRLSIAAGLSRRYTNHCLRATAITNLMESGFDPVTISRLSGHRNPSSITSYCKDVSDNTKRSMGGALSASLHQQPAVRYDQPTRATAMLPHTISSYEDPSAHRAATPHTMSVCPQAPALPSSTSSNSTAISVSNRQALTSSLFENCSMHIGTLNVYPQYPPK